MQSPPLLTVDLSGWLPDCLPLRVAAPGKLRLGWGETLFAITGLNPPAHALPLKVIAVSGGRRRELNPVLMSTQ